MSHFLQSTRSLLNSLGAFVLVIAGICLSPTASAVQIKPASNGGTRSSGLHQEPGTAQTSHASKEIPSCTAGKTRLQNEKPSVHTVYLSWQASSSPRVDGYNLYRYEESESYEEPEKPTKINSDPITATNCIDSTVALGKTYYYVAKAVNKSGESVHFSNVATAPIPLQ